MWSVSSVTLEPKPRIVNSESPAIPLSLDLDDLWSYFRVRGDSRWREYPSFLPLVVERLLSILEQKGLPCTWFIVGTDAAMERNRDLFEHLAGAIGDRHEIGNHSFQHESWLHLYSANEIADDLHRAEDAIETVTGIRPLGFRGPGYSVTPAVVRYLMGAGYHYDSSVCPNLLAPLARAVYLRGTDLDEEERRKRKRLGGTFRDALQPMTPFRWSDPDAPRTDLIEIPVTTMPGLRIPFHLSYLACLEQQFPGAAGLYLHTALVACRVTGVRPVVIIHPTDVLGCEDAPELSFFCGMGLPRERKLALLDCFLEALRVRYRIVTTASYASLCMQQAVAIPVRTI